VEIERLKCPICKVNFYPHLTGILDEERGCYVHERCYLVETLTDYNKLTEQYNELLGEYNDLYDEYSDLWDETEE